MSRAPTWRRLRSRWLQRGWLWAMLAGCTPGAVSVPKLEPSETSIEAWAWRVGVDEPRGWKPDATYVIDPVPAADLGDTVRAAAASSDGRLIALATGAGVDLFAGESLDWLGSVLLDDKPSAAAGDPVHVWLSPDGHFLARSDAGGTLRVCDLKSGSSQTDSVGRNIAAIGSGPNKFFIGHAASTADPGAEASLERSAVAVSPDARFAISVATNGEWLLIDRDDGSALALGKQDGGAATFSPSSRYLAVTVTAPRAALQLWQLRDLSLQRQLPLSEAELDLPPVFDRSETQIALLDSARRRARLCSLAAEGCSEITLPESGEPVLSLLPHGPSGFVSVSAAGEFVLVPELRTPPHALRAAQRIEPWPVGPMGVRASPSLDRMVVTSGSGRLGIPIQSSAGRRVADLTRLVEQRPTDAEIRAYAALLLPYVEHYPRHIIGYYWTEEGVRRRELQWPSTPTIASRNAGAFALRWSGEVPPGCSGPVGVIPLSLGVAEPSEYELPARPYPLALVPDGRGLLANTCVGLSHFAIGESTLSAPRLLAKDVFPDGIEVPPPGTHAITLVRGTTDDRLAIYPLASPSRPTFELSAPRLKYLLSEDGRYLATLTPTELRIWDWAADRVVRSWSVPAGSQLELRSVSRDGQLAVAMPDELHVWVFGPDQSIVRHPPLASRPHALSPDGSIAVLVDGSEVQLQRVRDSQRVRLIMLRLSSGERVIAAEAPGGLYSGFPSPRRLRRGGIFGGRLIADEIARRCFERSDLVASLFNGEPIESNPECAELVP